MLFSPTGWRWPCRLGCRCCLQIRCPLADNGRFAESKTHAQGNGLGLNFLKNKVPQKKKGNGLAGFGSWAYFMQLGTRCIGKYLPLLFYPIYLKVTYCGSSSYYKLKLRIGSYIFINKMLLYNIFSFTVESLKNDENVSIIYFLKKFYFYF